VTGPDRHGVYDTVCTTRKVAMTRHEAHRRAARWQKIRRTMRAQLCPYCHCWHVGRAMR
jgi:hypothetical protein